MANRFVEVMKDIDREKEDSIEDSMKHSWTRVSRSNKIDRKNSSTSFSTNYTIEPIYHILNTSDC